jgi:hypothetical protein
MKITEIIINPPRDEYLDQYYFDFKEAQPVAKISDLILKKHQSPTEINYGLFDKQDRLAGYFSLYYHGKDIWTVNLVQLAQIYKGQGLGSFFYDYAVMNDKLKIMSDATNTGGKSGSVALWNSLRDRKRYEIVGYDTITNEIIPNARDQDIYDGRSNTRWLALPGKYDINESIMKIQTLMKKRHVVWYGPGTTTEDYFNF